MTSEPLFQRVSSSRDAGAGGAFFLLALFAGILGGILGLPFLHMQPSDGMVVSHALLMTFYVVCPAFLGGMAQWFLSHLVGAERMALPSFSRMAFVALALGGFLLPLYSVAGVGLWACGVSFLAVNIIATILEMRTYHFRALSPLVWSFLAFAVSVLVMAPVVLALLCHDVADGVGLTALLAALRDGGESVLLTVPALGIVVAALLPAQGEHGRVVQVSPYAFGIMGGLPVLFWADHLFGGMSSTSYHAGLMAALVVPVLVLLWALIVDVWRVALPSGPAAGWALGALTLLLAGWGAELTTPLWAMSATIPAAFRLTGAGAGHQLVMFGALLALSAGFYGWCASYLPHYGRGFRLFAASHAVITFLGALCSIIPQLGLYAVLCMGGSLLMFALSAGFVWYSSLVGRLQMRAGFSSKH